MRHLLVPLTRTALHPLHPSTASPAHFACLTLGAGLHGHGLAYLHSCATFAHQVYLDLAALALEGFSGLLMHQLDQFGLTIQLLFDPEHQHLFQPDQTVLSLHWLPTDRFPSLNRYQHQTLLRFDQHSQLYLSVLFDHATYSSPAIPLPAPTDQSELGSSSRPA